MASLTGLSAISNTQGSVDEREPQQSCPLFGSSAILLTRIQGSSIPHGRVESHTRDLFFLLADL